MGMRHSDRRWVELLVLVRSGRLKHLRRDARSSRIAIAHFARSGRIRSRREASLPQDVSAQVRRVPMDGVGLDLAGWRKR
jgi:hypothetical protein